MPVTEETKGEISRLSAGNFLVLRHLCRHVATELPPTAVPAFLARLSRDTGQDGSGQAMLGFLYEENWNRIASRLAPAQLQALCDVAGLLVAAHAPLTEGILWGALGLGSADWDIARRHLAPYLTARTYEDDGVAETTYRVYHESFADFLRVKTAPDRARHHRQLADFVLRWSSLDGYSRRYALRFGPRHLLDQGRWNDVAALLLDLPFLEAKAEAGMVFELAGDFTDAVQALPADHASLGHLRLIEQALRSDLHFLARHPTALFQCLWNRCWWYDCPEAAAHYDPPPRGWPPSGPPWVHPAAQRLSARLEAWAKAKSNRCPGFAWLRSLRPPEHALGSPQLACLWGHEDCVDCVAFDHDGDRVVSASRDQTVRIWDARTGIEIHCLRGHQEDVNSVAFDRDDRRLVSGSRDQTVRIWDARTGIEIHCLHGHEGGVESVAFDRDGGRIVSGSADKTVRIWDARSGAETACLRGHEFGVTSVAFDRDGGRVVSGSNDETVRVWDTRTGAELVCIHGHEVFVTSVAFDRGGRRVVSGSLSGPARIWDARTGAEAACLHRPKGSVRWVAFDHDGRRVVGAPVDGSVRIWDARTGAEISCLRGHEGAVTSVAFDQDGRRVVSGSHDRTVRIWDVADGSRACLPPRARTDVGCVAFDLDGGRIVSGSIDATVRIWDAWTGAELACLRGHGDWFHERGVRPIRQRIVSVGGVTTVRCGSGTRGPVPRPPASAGTGAGSGAWRSTARRTYRVASGSNDGTVRVWDAFTGAETHCFRGHKGWVRSVAFDRDARHLIIASDDWTVRVWDARTGECLEVIAGCGDVEAIAEGPAAFPWRAIGRARETVVEAARGGEPIAWFPPYLWNITTHPSGRIWASASRNHLFLFRLEGEAPPMGSQDRGDSRGDPA